MKAYASTTAAGRFEYAPRSTLALRQAGRSLAEAVGREARPVTFVLVRRAGSTRNRPTSSRPWLELYPTHCRFKLDPATLVADDELVAELAATGRDRLRRPEGTVRGHRRRPAGGSCALPTRRSRRCLTPGSRTPRSPRTLGRSSSRTRARIDRGTRPSTQSRTSRASRGRRRTINIKPSRFGMSAGPAGRLRLPARVKASGAYGGGQFELGPGRGQIQYLASLFHPDAPNDVAPLGYNAREPKPGLPTSPLEPAPAFIGFRWAS